MFLQESFSSIKKLTKEDFNNKFDDLRLGQVGKRKNEKGELVYYCKYIGTRDKDFITIEFLSYDKEMNRLYCVTLYSPTSELIYTIYVQDNTSIKDIINQIKDIPLAESNYGMFTGEEKVSWWKALAAIPFTTKILVAYNVINLIVMVIASLFKAQKTAKLAIDQYDADRASEKRLNEFLFKGQKEDDPAFAGFRNITLYIQSLMQGTVNKNGVILYGVPGSSKTYMVRRSLYFSNMSPGSDYVIYKGATANPQKNTNIIYEILYRENGKLIIFDDFDSVLQDENVVNLLKAALDSYPERIISLPDNGSWDKSDFERIPPKFKFTGKILIISNKENIDPAILSRMLSVYINYTEQEWKQYIKDLMDYLSPTVDRKTKEEVYDYVEEIFAKNKNTVIDFRRFTSIVDLRVAYPNDWKKMALVVLQPSKD
jgi:hypothetical protein